AKLPAAELQLPPADDVPKELRAAEALLMAWIAQLARDERIEPSLLATLGALAAYLRGDPSARARRGSAGGGGAGRGGARGRGRGGRSRVGGGGAGGAVVARGVGGGRGGGPGGVPAVAPRGPAVPARGGALDVPARGVGSAASRDVVPEGDGLQDDAPVGAQ